MIRYTSGYICTAIPADRADELLLPSMVVDNQDPLRTSYTVTIDALGPDVTTGISANNRAHTVRTLADPQATAASFRRPGHVLPLKANTSGVRARRGHTEAAVELCRLAGKKPAGVLCEMILDGEPVPGRTEFNGGRMMRRDDCLEFGKKWGIKVCTIEDMVEYVEARDGKLKGH
jgi:3,4-dihydroxy 2-butanone 4-phosphate synthase